MKKTLYNNVKATFKSKWLQLTAIGIIIMMSSLIYTTMSYSISSLEIPTMAYLDEYFQEDFSIEMLEIMTEHELTEQYAETAIPVGIFTLSDLHRYDHTLFRKLVSNRIETIREIYPHLDLELRELKQIYFDHKGQNHQAMLVKDAKNINLSFIEKGEMPEQDHEIAISRIYAEKNSLRIGDTLAIREADYTISGFVLFPDYTFPMFGTTFLIDNAMQTLVLTTDNTFQTISGQNIYRLSGLIAEDKKAEFKSQVIDTISDHPELYFVLSVVLTENQMRSGAIFDELKGSRVFSLGFSIIIAGIAMVMVSLLVHRILKTQRAQIGVIRALGYKSKEITFPFIMFIFLLVLPLLIAGYFIGVLASGPMRDLYIDFYLLPAEALYQNWLVFTTAIIAPLAVFVLLSVLIIHKLLTIKPLDLLNPDRENEVNRLTLAANYLLKKVKPRTKFKYLYILKNSTKFFTFFIGIMLSTILIFIAFSMNGLVERMTTATFEKTAYQYQAYIDITKGLPAIQKDQEKFLSYPNATLGENSITAMGLEENNQLYNLYNDQGENITKKLIDGVVVTKSLSIKQNILPGDNLDISIANRAYPLTVKGVTEDYSADITYFEIEALSNMITGGKDGSLFSGVYSKQKPTNDFFTVVIDKEDIAEQALLMQRFMDYAVNFFIAISCLIAVLILFVLTTMAVEDNYYNISLLKVMGYRKKEVNAMILDSYLIYTVFSFLISIPLALIFLGWTSDFFTTNYDLVFPFEIRPIQILMALGILLAVFFAGTWNAKKKAAGISLQETLKAYRE